MHSSTNTYQTHYKILKEVAETLKNQTEPDIDSLISHVERALAAYRVCKERIESAKKALEEKFGE